MCYVQSLGGRQRQEQLRADAEGGLWALSSAKGLYKVIGSRAELRISLSRAYRLLLSTLYGIWMDLDGSKLLQQVDGGEADLQVR